MGRNQSFGMKLNIYTLACEIYEVVGSGRFTTATAAQSVTEQNLKAFGGRMYAMRNAGAIQVVAITFGNKGGNQRIRHYQFTQRWIAFKENEPAREARAERKRARAAELHQQNRVVAGVLCNGG